MDKNKFNVNKIIIILLVILAFLLLLFSVFFSLININNNNILNGISINGIDISGMSKNEAINTLNEIVSKKAENNITISTSDNFETSTTFDYLEIDYNINSYVNEAYNIGRTSNIFSNNFEIFCLLFNKKDIDLNIKFNENKLNDLIDSISSSLPNKMLQSSYYIEDNNLIITSGSKGYIVNKEKFTESICDVLNNFTIMDNYIDAPLQEVNPDDINIDNIYNEIFKEAKNAYYEKNPFKVYSEIIGISFDKEEAKKMLENNQDEYNIKLKYSYPKTTINDLDIDIFKDTLGYFTTKYSLSNTDRTNNLELAASKINGIIISPKEEFSYNKIVGARTIDAGYKEAKIYSNGQVVDGIGGGICQISSTLYNACIYANLDITERYNHQFITSYVPAGRDATVVYGAKDFKFKNNRSYPIKLEMKVLNGIVYCSILGLKEQQEYDVDFDIETVSLTEPPTKYEYDKSLDIRTSKVKQNGSNATTVNVYKIVKLDGNILSRTLLSSDTYSALEKIIVTGNSN